MVDPRRLAGAEPTRARRCHSERDWRDRSRMPGANLCPQLPHLLCWPLTDGPQCWNLTVATFLGSRTLWVQNLAGHRRKRLVSAPPGPGRAGGAGGSADRSLLWAATLPGSGSEPGIPRGSAEGSRQKGGAAAAFDPPQPGRGGEQDAAPDRAWRNSRRHAIELPPIVGFRPYSLCSATGRTISRAPRGTWNGGFASQGLDGSQALYVVRPTVPRCSRPCGLAWMDARVH